MTAPALPDIDRAALEDLKKRLPDLSDVDISLPRMEEIGRTADQTVDRLLGRSRAPAWPRVLAAVGLIAVLGLLVAWMTWGRRPGWGPAPEDQLDTPVRGDATGLSDAGTYDPDAPGQGTMGEVAWDRPEGSGLTAAEASLTSNVEPDERA
jgi:hypothetical protein